MREKLFSALLLFCCVGLFSGCANSEDNAGASTPPTSQTAYEPPQSLSETSEEESELSEATPKPTEMTLAEQNDLGALTPENALSYMQEAENLVIVDVAATKWYDEEHFDGAINIPIEELDSEKEDSLYMEIPEGRPVLLHCRQGAIVPGAYRRVKELRPDIPEITYIDVVPPFSDYNEWLENQN